MANKQGTNQIVDAFIGNKLIEARHIGAIKYFDAYTEITGALPLSFNSRVAGALKNYRVYGAENGAGVQTINLLDVNAKDTDNGYVANAYLSTDGKEKPAQSGSSYAISEYIPVSPSTQYSISNRKVSAALCFYNASKEYISGEAYTYARPRRFTSPSNAAYLRMTILEQPLGKRDMLLAGDYAEEPAYEPFGYKIPLLNTSGVTENLIEKSDIDFSPNTTIAFTYLQLEPNTQYTAWTDFPYNATSDVFIRHGKTDSVTSSQNGFSDGHPRTASTNEEGWITIATRYNSNRPNPADYNYMLVKGSTAPDHYIPHRYTSDIPIYIGSTKLREEEYADFGEQKVYKRTENYFSLATPVSGGKRLNANGSVSSASFWITIDYIPVSGRTFTLSPVASNSVLAAICAYDSDKNLIKGQAYGTVSDTPYDVTISCDSDVSFIRFCYYTKVVAKADIMLVEGSTAPASYIPYLQPTDPPVSLPAISAYEGENTLSDPMVQTEAYSFEQGNYGGNPGEQLFKHNSSHDYFNKAIRVPSILTVPAGQKWLIATKIDWATTIRIANSSGIVISTTGSNGITTNPIVIEASTSERKLGIHTSHLVNGSVVQCVPSDYGGDLDITVVDAGALGSMMIKGRISETT